MFGLKYMNYQGTIYARTFYIIWQVSKFSSDLYLDVSMLVLS